MRLVACAAAVVMAAGHVFAEGPPRPNILMVHCHDLGQHLCCYGVKTVQTPNLDGFAAEGVRFARSFCTNPGCSPSRASLFTGRYPHSNGVMGLCHANFAWDLHPAERHLGQYLRDAGYARAAVGIIHETRSGAARCGYEKHIPQAKAEPATTAAIAELRRLGAEGRPFFLSVGFIEPHRLPYPPGPDGAPGGHGFPGPHLQPDDTLGVQVPGYLRDTEGTRRELAGLQGAVRHVDAQFGRLMAALKESGIERDTVVLFTTDHGIAMPRAKCSVYEPGLQVALILRYPVRDGWRGGAVREEMVSNVDVVPTLLELLGIAAPATLHGKSFAPLLDGKPYAPREAVFGELTYHGYYDPRRSVRTANHKLIANFSSAPAFQDPSQAWRPQSDPVTSGDPATGHAPDLELYDLAADPWEQQNLAAKPEHAGRLRELAQLLHRHMTETADPLLAGAIACPQHERAMQALRGAAAP